MTPRRASGTNPRESWGDAAPRPGCIVAICGLAATLAVAPACNGTIVEPEGEPPVVRPFVPSAPVMPRLTTRQYRNSIEDLLGGGALPPTPVEPDTNPYLYFTIGAATTTVSEGGVQQYEEASLAATAAAFADPARRDLLVGCIPTEPGDACAESFVVAFGRRVFRRPLDSDEVDRWTSVTRDLADGGDAWLGIRMAAAGMLQSPSFVYRIEVGEPDPDHDGGRRRYTGYEMAARLSFLFWETTPDEELLDAAERGELVTPDGIRAQAQRLLADDRARGAIQSFFAQYLDLGRLDHATRDTTRYPLWTATMARSMRTEVELLVDDLVFRRDGDARELFSSRRTFVNTELAALYGVEAPDASPVAFVRVDLPAGGPRAGVLTLGAFLAMNAHETDTSPTLRGKYLRERVFCQNVPPPPPDVITDLTPDETMPRTLRERLEEHRRNPICASCHSFMDPPGMLFESFDSSGAYRTTDAMGFTLDTSGDLDGAPLATAGDLAEMLRTDPRVPACMVRQLFRHASGRLERGGDEGALRSLQQSFASSGYSFQSLLVELAASEGFRSIAAPEGAGE